MASVDRVLGRWWKGEISVNLVLGNGPLLLGISSVPSAKFWDVVLTGQVTTAPTLIRHP
jgi:hypothetical protein